MGNHALAAAIFMKRHTADAITWIGERWKHVKQKTKGYLSQLTNKNGFKLRWW